eukprot:TRINITY_DN2198_c0_g1_i13.p2 TRINITY_DN2198_c0_g1~~TRINITY_DN2198_c0_g1_i13.p2  ORF type:complete len:318 (+),score=68.86 TRINITY_DN2198_c0_g1_i13:261-1214(+)
MRRLRHRHRPSFRISVSAPFVAGAGAGRGRAHLVVTPGGQTLLTLRFGWATLAAQGAGPSSCGRLGFAGTAVGTPASGWDVSGTAFHAFRRPAGLRLVRSSQPVAASVAALEEAIASGPDKVKRIGRVDHDVAAASVGLRLAPSTVVAFGGIPPVAATFLNVAAAGVAVPPEVAVADSPLGVPYVTYNTASQLKVRFDLPANVDAPLGELEAIQARLASAAAGWPSRRPASTMTRRRWRRSARALPPARATTRRPRRRGRASPRRSTRRPSPLRTSRNMTCRWLPRGGHHGQIQPRGGVWQPAARHAGAAVGLYGWD